MSHESDPKPTADADRSPLRASAGCPPLEELACLVDGVLSPEEAEAILGHVLACSKCYEIYVGLLRFQLAEPAEAAEGGQGKVLPLLPRRSSEERGAGPSVGTESLPQRKAPPPANRPIFRWASLAAGLVLSAGLAYLVDTQWTNDGGALAPERGALAAQHPEVLRLALAEGKPPKRGAGDEPEIFDRGQSVNLSIRIGALLTDLDLAQRTEDSRVVARALEALADQTQSGRLVPELAADLKKLAASAARLKSPKDLAPDIQRAVRSLRKGSLRRSAYLELGEWTETARLAAKAKSRSFFSVKNRGYVADLLSDRRVEGLPLQLGEVIPAALQEIDRLWPDPAVSAPPDYQGLDRALSQILGLQRPGPRESDPKTGAAADS